MSGPAHSGSVAFDRKAVGCDSFMSASIRQQTCHVTTGTIRAVPGAPPTARLQQLSFSRVSHETFHCSRFAKVRRPRSDRSLSCGQPTRVWFGIARNGSGRERS
ncbi:hypothetical protein [Pseudomonas fluorescens]|nr:hypothetical protein [Pseudomonas fluorescens]